MHKLRLLSFLHGRESILQLNQAWLEETAGWIPACAGMTAVTSAGMTAVARLRKIEATTCSR